MERGERTVRLVDSTEDNVCVEGEEPVAIEDRLDHPCERSYGHGSCVRVLVPLFIQPERQNPGQQASHKGGR